MMEEALEELERVAPKNSEIAIDVKEDPTGYFSTFIKLHAWNKTYIVKKEDIFLYKSFNKAVKAIKSRIQKKKVNHESIKSEKYFVA